MTEKDAILKAASHIAIAIYGAKKTAEEIKKEKGP